MIPIELRYAIWIAYSKRDEYRGHLIENFDDLEIDHIIPKSTDAKTLNEKIDKYNLGKDFKINSIENLIPTSKFPNRQKSAMAFNESNERYFLNIAAEKKNKVTKEWNKTIKNRKLKEKIQFIKSYNIVDSEQYWIKPSYFNSDTLVALNAYLPSKFDLAGSCAIEFYEMGTMITLNHEALTSLINNNTSTLEEQLLQYYNVETKIAFIIVGSSSLHIKKEAYDQLITILNNFLMEYEKFSHRFEDFMGTKNFEKVGPGYKLIEIQQEEWDYLISYSYVNDIDSNKHNQFCFNVNPNSLIALSLDHEAVVFLITPFHVMNKICVLWHLPTMRERGLIDEGKVWNAVKTAEWIKYTLNNYKIDKQPIKPQKNRKVTLYKLKKFIFRNS